MNIYIYIYISTYVRIAVFWRLEKIPEAVLFKVGGLRSSIFATRRRVFAHLRSEIVDFRRQARRFLQICVEICRQARRFRRSEA